MFKLTISLFILLTIACNQQNNSEEKASNIIKQCIEAHGGKNYHNMDVSFDFRQFNVHLKQHNGQFLYERTTKDSLNNGLRDVITNDTFYREVNGQKQTLSQADHEKYKNGINAIAYFVLLPYKLSEPAVNLKYLGETIIENKKYDKIGVSFDQAGGGKDHEDEFCFWINQNGHTLDYLAYASGGPRFRKATKRERIAGIIFQDYENYELADTTLSTADYDKTFIAGKAKLLSKIEQQHYRANKPSAK